MFDQKYADLKCFIITPIGGDNTDTRRSAEGVIDTAVIPVLKNLGFEEKNIFVPHRMKSPGSITNQVIKEILEADLVIANLSGLNANVMYELALRHAARKSVIPICHVGTTLPFDIVDQRTIFFVNDIAGARELQIRLADTIPEALNEQTSDNPVYRVINDNLIKNDPDAKAPVGMIIERMEALERSTALIANTISKINNKFNNSSSIFIGGGVGAATLNSEPIDYSNLTGSLNRSKPQTTTDLASISNLLGINYDLNNKK